MKKVLFFIAFVFTIVTTNAQFGPQPKDTTWKTIYRATPEVINDLVHTKLECSFDYDNSRMYGKVWITLQPHFYTTDSLTLDAKGMDIKEVAMMKGTAKQKLQYTYDGKFVRINLGKAYKGGEKYTVYIDYISKPNEIEVQGSAAISDAKGLYFINPKGEDKNKPTQIWTQGETEATSVWCPTIDRPNQNTTQEIYMTVPAKYVTLSNGILKSQKKNKEGTRTDYWSMDLPHAPYLFFMGVGDFAVVKGEPYKTKEVSYYVEKDQAAYAKGVFGNTTEMMKFFSDKLGVDYPWAKYAQMVGRDYVSGAMENTTATLHQESAYQNARQLADGNSWEQTIAHELFHQWFGDLVTAESWSNLTVNESFANYSEYLWEEYKYGKDAADEHQFDDAQGYLFSGSEKKDLVRYHYFNKEDMFDAVSYNKGGRILHMLRNYVGDAAFFKSLQLYLNTNKFKPGEAGQLRLAFEEVTGKDMNWFWNQWYYGSGHPELEISNSYNEVEQKLMVVVQQKQKADKVWRVPVNIDVYTGNNKARNTVWLQNKVDTFYFNYSSKPALVDFDGDRTLLAKKKDSKTSDEYVMLYEKNSNYTARREALDYFATNKMKELSKGLKSSYAGIRNYTLGKILNLSDKTSFLNDVEKLLVTEKDNKTKAAAIKVLARTKEAKYKDIYTKNVDAFSYSVSAAALEGLSFLQPDEAYTMAKKYSSDAKGALGAIVNKLIIDKASETDFDYLANLISNAPLSQTAFTSLQGFATYLSKIKNIALVKKGIDAIGMFKNRIPTQFLDMVLGQFKQFMAPVSKAHGEEIKTYIDNMLK